MTDTIEINITGHTNGEGTHVAIEADDPAPALNDELWLDEQAHGIVVLYSSAGRDVLQTFLDHDGWHIDHLVETGAVDLRIAGGRATARGPIDAVDTFATWPPTADELVEYLSALSESMRPEQLLEVYEQARRIDRANRTSPGKERAA